MRAVDYYQLLGVDRRASRETLRQAFRARMLDMHPDLHPGDALAGERTREIVDAYKALSDSKARRAYDTSLAGPEISNLEWSYAEPAISNPLTRSVLLLLVVAVAAVALLWAVKLAAASRVPVYRFQTNEMWVDPEPTRVALLVEPDIRHSMEWYQTVEYQLRRSSPLVTQTTAEVYVRAMQMAQRRGDYAAAYFYRSGLLEIRRARMPDISLTGAKQPLGSS
jgi:hypothetical protein